MATVTFVKVEIKRKERGVAEFVEQRNNLVILHTEPPYVVADLASRNSPSM